MHTTADIPYVEPEEITAGNTVKWKKDLDHYSAAASWVLKYYLRGPKVIDITATQDGSSATHSVSVSATTTADWIPGDYKWKSFVTKGTERFPVEEGLLTILENWEKINSKIEIRSDAQIILDAHMTAYTNRASRPEQSYTVQGAGRTFNYKTDMEMIRALQFWKAEVAKETKQAPQIVKMIFK